MRIGVVQHRLRPTAAEDVRALTESVREAAAGGAEVVVIPCVPGIAGEAVRDGVMAESRTLELPCGVFAPTCYAPGHGGVIDSSCCAESVGPVVAMCGDTCFDESLWRDAASQGATVAVMSPQSESELQAEAALELALGLSDSLCGLVIVSECVGAEPGEPGHGGSAVIMLGKVLAEALGDDPDVLFADVELPLAAPEPRAPFPELPTILSQRVALHAGHKLEVAYPADLSDGLRTSS